jgi:hypothetical protein
VNSFHGRIDNAQGYYNEGSFSVPLELNESSRGTRAQKRRNTKWHAANVSQRAIMISLSLIRRDYFCFFDISGIFYLSPNNAEGIEIVR